MSYSPNPEVNATIEALLAIGCPPIPVAPVQDPYKPGCHQVDFSQSYRMKFSKDENGEVKSKKEPCFDEQGKKIDGKTDPLTGTPIKWVDQGVYCPLTTDLKPIPRFFGKNPSYLSKYGTARICTHGKFQEQLPTEQELKEFFCNPNTGVGTLGGHAGVIWLDFDAKNYESQEICDNSVQEFIEKNGLTHSWIEKTGSGGYRIAVRPKEKPTFTNFALTPGGKHIGEALWKGRFTVLAPSIHPNGKRYQRISLGEPIEVESLESIGIYPSKEEVTNKQRDNERKKRKEANPDYGKPTNAAENPWDIRNFAHYFLGWHTKITEDENGDEVEWGYAKCPAHDGTSMRSFRLHLPTGGYKVYCGCDTKEVYKAGLALAKSQGFRPSTIDETALASNKYNEIKKYLENFKEEERTKAGKPKKNQQLNTLDKYEKKVLEVQFKLNSLTYKPDIELNEEFLPQNLYTQLPCLGIVAIKSRKASGKSGAILKPLIWGLKWQKKKIISITPRLVLGGEQCEKFDIVWVDEYSEEHTAVGVCWDSLHKLMHIDWDVVIIDEARAGLKHLVTANTAIKKNRSLILSCFANLINNVTKKGGLVLMCDADLTDIEVDYVKEVAHENTPIFTVINHHKGFGQDIEFQLGKKDIIEQQILDDISQQFEEVALSNDESKYRPFIVVSDSQAELEALEYQLYEQIPQLRAEYDWDNLSKEEKQKIIGISTKTIRIDKKTTETSFGKNFVRKPDEAVQKHKPLILAYSPTMAFGVSIQTFHFTKIYALYTGVLEPCEFRQQLKRYRPDVHVTIWASERNDNYNSVCTSPLPDVIKDTVNKNATDAAEPDIIDFAIQIARQKCNGDVQSFQKVFTELLEENKWDNVHINLWANIQARSNFAKPRCALVLLQELKELENARVTLRMTSNSSFGENVKQQKKEDKFESAKIMHKGFNSDWTQEEARETLNDSNSTWGARLHAEGVLLKEFLPGVELTPEFIFERKLHDVSWLSNQYLYWSLNNPDVAKALDAKKWELHCSKWNVFGTIFLPDLSLKLAKVRLLQDLQIIRLVNTEGDFSDDSPIVKTVINNAFKHKERVKRLFNLSLTEGKTKPIKLIGRLLEKIGLTQKRSRSDGKKRFYMVYGSDCPDRLAVLKAWNEKYAGYGLNDETLERFTPNPELTHQADIYKENADVSVPPQVDTTPAQLTDQTCIYKENANVSVAEPLTETTSNPNTTSDTTSHQTTVFEHLPELTHLPVIYKETPDVSVDENADFSDLIALSDKEIKRLGWSRTKAHQYLKDAFGKRSRQLMSNAELIEFVRSLKSLTGREFYYIGQEFTTTVTAKNDSLWSERRNVIVSTGAAFKEVFCNLADTCWTFVTHEWLKGYNPLSLKLSDLQLVQ